MAGCETRTRTITYGDDRGAGIVRAVRRTLPRGLELVQGPTNGVTTKAVEQRKPDEIVVLPSSGREVPVFHPKSGGIIFEPRPITGLVD